MQLYVLEEYISALDHNSQIGTSLFLRSYFTYSTCYSHNIPNLFLFLSCPVWYVTLTSEMYETQCTLSPPPNPSRSWCSAWRRWHSYDSPGKRWPQKAPAVLLLLRNRGKRAAWWVLLNLNALGQWWGYRKYIQIVCDCPLNLLMNMPFNTKTPAFCLYNSQRLCLQTAIQYTSEERLWGKQVALQ